MLRFLPSVAGYFCLFLILAISNSTGAQTLSNPSDETKIGFKIVIPSSYELQWLTGDGNLAFAPVQTAGSHTYDVRASSTSAERLWLHPVHNAERRSSELPGYFVSINVSDLTDEETKIIEMKPPTISLSETLESLRKSKDFDIKHEDYVRVLYILDGENQGRVASCDILGIPGKSETGLLKLAKAKGKVAATLKLSRNKNSSLPLANSNNSNTPFMLPFAVPEKMSLGLSPQQYGAISQRPPTKAAHLNVSIDADTTARFNINMKESYGVPDPCEVQVQILGLRISSRLADAVAKDSIGLWYNDDKREIQNGKYGVRCLYVPNRPNADAISLVQFYQKWTTEGELTEAHAEVMREASNLGTPIATVFYYSAKSKSDDPALAEVRRKFRELLALSDDHEVDVDNIGKQLADHYRMILNLKWDQQKQLIEQQEEALAKLRERIRLQEENSDAVIKQKVDEVLSGFRRKQ